MTRRIVQIAADEIAITALADDGTLWGISNHTPGVWQRLPDIPQDEPAEPDPITERTGPPNLRVGDRVIYVPGHARGDISHADCEYGTVSSFGVQQTAFVLYDGDQSPKATTRSDLVRLDTEEPEPAAAPDPIAKLEAMGGRLHVDSTLAWLLATPGATPDVEVEEIDSEFATISDLRAAAARLLARVRGAK